ncbi:MAG: phage tail tape measure protein [Eubacteriales bacterium]|nr:phage tail tape measure protein [Eubacteriales bacterium]
MAKNIKGITIEIGAETKGFRKQIAELSKEGRSLATELRAVEKALKFDSNNTGLLLQKQELLNKSIEATNTKLIALKKAKEKADEEMAKGTEVNEKQYRELVREIANTESYLGNLKRQSASVSESMKSDQEKIIDKTTELNKKLEEVENALEFDPKNLILLKEKQELLNKSADTLNETIKTQTGKLKEMAAEYKKVTEQEGENSASAIDLKNQIESLTHEISENQKKANDLRNESLSLENEMEELGEATENTRNNFSAMNVAIGTLIANAIGKLASSLKNLGKEIINITMNFESGLSEVKAISNATTNEMDKLEKKARELGESTKFSAIEVTDAFKYMAMAGWEVDSMLNSIDGVLNLAAATETDLAMASDIVTDAMTGFKLTSKETARFVDVLAATSSSANTNVELMGETFKYVAPVAGTMGYTIEDTALAIGLMASAGIKGEQAGTSLRSIMSRLVAPTKESNQAIEKLGISITDAEGDMRPFNDILVEVREKMSGLSTEQQGLIAKQLAGQNAMSGLLAIVNASNEDFQKVTESINNSNGAAERMAKTMQDNLKGKFTVLKSTLEGIAISFGKILYPVVEKIIQVFQTLANWILNLDEKSQALIVIIPIVATVLGALYLAITKLSKGMSNANTEITELQASMNKVQSIFLIVTSVIAGLSIAFKDNEKVSAILNATLVGLVTTFAVFKTYTAITGIISGLTVAMSAYSASTGAATGVTAAFNAVISANPIGLAVAAIAGLTAGLVALVKFFNKASEEAQEFNSETEKIIETSKDLNKATKENKKAFEDSTKSIEGQTSSYKKLAEEIEELASAEELSEGQTLLLQKKIDELNSSVDGLNVTYDEQTRTLSMNSEAIEEQIELQEAELKLNEGLEEQARIREEIATVTEAERDIKSRLAEVEMLLNDAETSRADKKLLVEQQEELNLALEETSSNIDGLNTAYDELGLRIETNASIVEEANRLKVESEQEYQDTLSQTGYVADMVATLDEEAKERAQKTLEEFTGYATNAFNKINEEASLSMNELIGNLEYNQTLLEEWTTDLATMMDKGYDKAFVENLREMGPEMAATVKTMANATEEEIGKFNATIEKGANVASNSFITTMTSEGVISVGSDMLNSVADGMKKNESVNTASKNSIKDAKTSMDKQVKVSNFSTVGTDINSGIANGIKNSEAKVISAVKNVAKKAKETFQEELDIHSPSRVFKTLAGFINEGIAEGLEDSSGLPSKAMKKICTEIINSGDEISTGLISIDEETGEAIYDNTYKAIMEKIDLFEKERDKRIEALEKTNELTEEYLEKEIEGAEKVHNTKIKLMEQEYLAKVSLIDEESAKQIQALNAQIEEINRKKEEEKKAEQERKYQEEYEEKVRLLNQAIGDYEEYTKRKKELDELVAKRKKELLEEEREAEKQALREQIELIKAQATESKEILKEELSDAKFKESLNQDSNMERLNSFKESLNEEVEAKQETDNKKIEINAKTNTEITKNESKEFKEREKELKAFLKNNTNHFYDFQNSIANISKKIGELLLEGIKSTETEINSYLASLSSLAIETDYNSTLRNNQRAMQSMSMGRSVENNSSHSTEINMNFYNVKEEKTAFRLRRETQQTIKGLGLA